MNLEQKMENLILKYNIDCCNPEYQQYIKARGALYELISGVQRIALVANDIGDIGEVKFLIGEKHTVSRHRFPDLAEIDSNIEMVICLNYVINSKQRELICNLEQNRGIKTIFLYDYLKQQGVVCNREFYDVLGGKRAERYGNKSTSFDDTDYYGVIYRIKKQYKRARGQEQKEGYLKELIFSYIYIRDFINSWHYIGEYVQNQYKDYLKYEEFQKKTEELLKQAKEKSYAKKNQMFIFWVDALGKGEENGMPCFQALQENSLNFENAFTVTPTTSATIKAIFLKKRFCSDSAYKISRIYEKDSPLLKYLHSNGYDFRYFGMEERMEEKLYGKRTSLNAPSSRMYWDFLCDLCDTEQKCCYLLHSLTETHAPFLHGMAEDYYYDIEIPPKDDKERQERHQQREEAKEYFDCQFEFYRSFINDDNLQIIMSDHAGEGWRHHRGKGTNVNLFVRGKNIRKGKINNFFSYIDFDALVRYLFTQDESVLESVLKDCIYAEYPDIYSKNHVTSRLKENWRNIDYFGWKCCATYEEEYVVYTMGREEYFRYPSWMNRVGLPEYADRIQVLREDMGEIFTDVLGDNFFRYSRLLHHLWANYIKRTGGTEIGVTCLCKSMEDILPDKVIAIRGGGRHTKNLLTVLGESATRIRYIVDKNKEICEQTIGRDGLQVEFITPGEMKAKKIDVVILSSLEYRKEMRDELFQMNQDYQILDVYEMLEEQGIYLNEGFYVNKLLPEDYEGIMVDE